MKQGSLRGKVSGFTIIEVMIVFAVSAVLFAMVAVIISGKQASAEFGQSIHNVQSQIQAVMNEVGSGFYPNSNNFSCSATSSGVSITNGTNAQGTNKGCVFLGKAIDFYDTNPDIFRIYSLAGFDQLGSTANDIVAARPIVMTPGINNTPSAIDNSQDIALNYGLNVHSMQYKDSAGTAHAIGSFAFTQSLGLTGSGGISSGSQHINVVALATSQTRYNKPVKADELNVALQSSSSIVNPAGGIQICFASGGTNQSGLITIGSNGGQMTVNLDIMSNGTCS